MQTEAPLRPTHRPRVRSVASATPAAPAVPTKSNLRRSYLGPISSNSSSDISNSQEKISLFTDPSTPPLPIKSPNRPTFRFKGNALQLGSEEFGESSLLGKTYGNASQISEDSEAEIDLTDGVSSGTHIYDSEKEYQNDVYPDTPKDSPPNQNNSLESLEKPRKMSANSFKPRKSSFLEARNKFLASQSDSPPPSLNQPSFIAKGPESSEKVGSILDKVASFESNTSSIKSESYSTIKEKDVNPISQPREASEDCTPRATFLGQISSSPVSKSIIFQEPEPIYPSNTKDAADHEKGSTIFEFSKKIDTANVLTTATIKEAPEEETFAQEKDQDLTESCPINQDDTDQSDFEGEVEICTIKKAEACTQFHNISTPTSKSSQDGKENAQQELPDTTGRNISLEIPAPNDSQSTPEPNQEAVHLQLTKLSQGPSDNSDGNTAEFDGFNETLVSSPPSSYEKATEEPPKKSGKESEGLTLPIDIVKSKSDTPHKYNHSSSMRSWSSQESVQSEGGIMNKVRNLYDMFQTRSKTPSGKSLFPAQTRGIGDGTMPAVHISKSSESKNFQYQNISKMVRRLSLMDMTPPADTRAASLYSVEELDADNVDWEFWGQLVNNYESMAKSNYAVLQKSIRQGIPVSMRGMVWQLLAEIRNTGLVEVYGQLLTRTSPHEKSITADLPRTFPQLAYFKSRDGTGQESLFNVLKCYSLYDPEVGYCQGLSFLAGPLLLNMPDEEAFCVLVRMMEGLRLHFTPAMEGLQVRTYQFERMMEESLPQVYQHLQEQGIQSTMYASQWFMTLFAYRSSMRLVFRVLDILLLEGGDILVKVALALLKDNVDRILSRRFDDLIAYLKSGIFDLYQDRTDHLIAMACDQKLPERRMSKWRREYMAEIAKQAEDEAYAASLQGMNDQLSESNKDLAHQLKQLTQANQDLSEQLISYQDALSARNDRNAALEHRLNEMEALLHTERQRAEASLVEQMDVLAQKNLSLVTKNADLEDALAQAEDTIISLKAALSSRP
ncbi:GTPase-activating protein [Entomophthora muscae]|uniref:GTPase-activating protein n=1 Tax=Entomophthora muscae TaxID=34485 RepID=A0ACC2SKT8_9FUNG|nr:GTPase-activating protein [Entomophthora muscae]